jgi:hypothetical protein
MERIMKHFGAYLWEGNANGMVKNVLNLGLKTVKALNISFILILFYMGELMVKRLFSPLNMYKCECIYFH